MHALVRLVVVGSLAAGLGCTGQNAGFPMSAATDAGPDVGTSSADADAADAQDAGPPAPARHRIACGYDFTCAIHGDGRVKCWGQNNRGQLGIGSQDVHGLYGKGMGNDLPFVDLGPGEKAVSLSLGREHACALLESGKVKCWGGNGSGQLGLGSHFQPGAHPQDMGSQLAAVDLGSGRTAITISAGDESTCAVLDDHTVKCWGNNDGGQLGLGPVLSAGGDAGQMGDALPVVDLGPQAKVVDLSAGFRDTCAVLVGGALKCWGANDIGQLGTGDPTQHGTTLESMGAALPSPDLGTPFAVASASAGGNVECAVDTTGMLKCFGQNNYGQLGLGDTKTRGLLPGDMAAALAPVDLGAGTQVAAAAAGGTFTCALLASGSVKCFGDNGNGQLAQGDTLSRGGQPQDMGDNLPAINFGVTVPAVELAAGMQHACARFADGSIRCWGTRAALGVDAAGKTGDILGDEPVDLGANWPAVNVGDAGPTPGAVVSDCQFTRNGCESVCGNLYRSCSATCSELGGSLGAVYSSQAHCDAMTSPVDMLSKCSLLESATAQYIRCCCE